MGVVRSLRSQQRGGSCRKTGLTSAKVKTPRGRPRKRLLRGIESDDRGTEPQYLEETPSHIRELDWNNLTTEEAQRSRRETGEWHRKDGVADGFAEGRATGNARRKSEKQLK